MADPTQDVDINFRAQGLDRLKAGWADFAGDLLEPIAILAAGGSKVTAAWAGAKGMFESRVIGPISLAAGAAAGFLVTTRTLISKWRDMGTESSAALEKLTLQFRPLLGSMELAKRRVADLVDFTAKTPWKLEESAEANKMLESLTRGALSTKDGMMLVGDAAAVAGAGFAETARQVGRLYDGLIANRPVGEATMRLQELGLISGTTRNQIESMQAANVSGLETWRVVEAQLRRNQGAQDALSQSMKGLESTAEDTAEQLESAFSDGFLDGKKAGIESSIKMMEALTPVAKEVGAEVGRIENAWARLKLRIVESITSWSGFKDAVEWGSKALVGLAAVIVGTTTAAIAGFLVKLLLLAAGHRTEAQAAAMSAAAASAQIPIMTKLRAVKESLIASHRAHAAGLRAEAAAQLNASAAGVRNIVTTNGLVGATRAGRLAFSGLGMAVRFVGAQMKAMMLSMVANPMFWLLAAATALAMGLSKLAENQKRVKEEQEEYARATSALGSKLAKDIREIRTLADQRRVEAQVVRELAQAYVELGRAQGLGKDTEKKASAGKVALLQQRLDQVRTPKFLEKSEEDMKLDASLRNREEEAGKARGEDRARKGPEEEREVTIELLKEQARRHHEANQAMWDELNVRRRQEEAQRKAADAIAKENVLLEDRAQLEGFIAKAQKRMEGEKGTSMYRSLEKIVISYKEQIQNIDRELTQIASLKLGGGDVLAEGLASPSRLQVLKTQLAVYDELRAAEGALAEKKGALESEKDPKKLEVMRREIELMEVEFAARKKLAQQAGVRAWDPGDRQAAAADITEREARREDDLDPVKADEASRRVREAELQVGRARLDAEAQVAALRMEGYDREVKLLDIEAQKLEAQKQAGAIGEKEYARQRELLDARGEAAARDARERGISLRAAFEQSRLSRLAEEAREKGKHGTARYLQRQADERADSETRRQALKEAKEVNAPEADRQRYANARVIEEREAREAERRRRSRDQADGRERDRAEQASGIAVLQERMLKLQGRGEEARRAREAAARRRDEVDRTEARKKFLEQGFNSKQSGEMAGTQVKLAQANRQLEQLMGSRGSVVASSLAQIGGGGNVYGNDPNTRLLEQLRNLVQQIRDNGRRDVDW